MGLSERAWKLMCEMREAAKLRQECVAVEKEYQTVLVAVEDGDDIDFGLLGFLGRERSAYRKALARRRARNWAILVALCDEEASLGSQVLKLRYAMGYSWRTIVRMVGKNKKEVLEAHDEALNALAEEVTECMKNE